MSKSLFVSTWGSKETPSSFSDMYFLVERCCIRWGIDRRREGAVFVVNVGLPIVTSVDFVAWLFSDARGGDAALPILLWDFLFIS